VREIEQTCFLALLWLTIRDTQSSPCRAEDMIAMKAENTFA